MNRIESKVASARRRLLVGLWCRAFCLAAFVCLIVATIAIAVPAFWVVEIDYANWAYGWIGGAIAAACLAASVFTILAAPSRASVAAEVDRRFGLRERLSSAVSLHDQERDSPFGLALVEDADRRAGQLSIAERFALRPGRIGLLPIALVPLLILVVALVEPAKQSAAGLNNQIDAAEIKQVKVAASQLKKRIEQQRRKAEAQGLKDAEELFEKLEADLDKLSQRKGLDRKDAMIAMNDLKEQLEQRRDQLGSSEQVRRAMAQMKGLQSGPGDKVAKSIEKGEFGKAEELVKQLAEKIRDGKLSEQEKQELKQQIEQMKDQLDEAAKEHERQKQQLQEQIEQARREGRSQDAERLQQKLNEKQQQDAQMQRMQQMAGALGQASQAMQQGDGAQAAQALEQMAQQLGDMQLEMSELEDLESALGDLSQSKNQMRCQQCDGGGCQQCQGMGSGFGMGNGLGRGQGQGDRPEAETDTNTYESQVRGQVKRGKAIIAGYADGPNRKGVSQEDIKAAIEASLSEESDPLENQSLPRAEREHAQQYFDRLRDGT